MLRLVILSLLDQIVIVIRQWLRCGSGKLSLMLLLHGQVEGHFRRLESHGFNKVNVGITSQLPCKVKEGLLKVVVALGRDFIVLQVLLPVECDLLGLNLPVLHINLVTAEYNGDVLTHPAQVSVPRRNILVSQP